jgi:hypothetical protein
LAPGAGAIWRFGPERRLGTVDASTRAGVEWRAYDTGGAGSGRERQATWAWRSHVDLWVDPHASVGPYLALAWRRSTLAANDYDRMQYGLRLAAFW